SPPPDWPTGSGSDLRDIRPIDRRAMRMSAARVGPTTPTRQSGLPLAVCRLDRLSRRRTLFAAERLSPSARERVPIEKPATRPATEANQRCGQCRLLTEPPDSASGLRRRPWVVGETRKHFASSPDTDPIAASGQSDGVMTGDG